jgi:hypothetical protein
LTSTAWLQTGLQHAADPPAPTNTGEVSIYFRNGRPKFIPTGGTASDLATGDSTGAAILAPVEAYDANGWNGDTAPPQKDGVRDRFEALLPSGVLADASRNTKDRTRQFTFLLGADNGSTLADTDDQATIFANRLGSGITINEVHCESDAGAPTINLQRDDGSAANILSSNLSCSASGTTGTIDTNEANVANGERIDFVMVTAGTAKRVTVSVRYTVN